jgi:hypothetical protein
MRAPASSVVMPIHVGGGLEVRDYEDEQERGSNEPPTRRGSVFGVLFCSELEVDEASAQHGEAQDKWASPARSETGACVVSGPGDDDALDDPLRAPLAVSWWRRV